MPLFSGSGRLFVALVSYRPLALPIILRRQNLTKPKGDRVSTKLPQSWSPRAAPRRRPRPAPSLHLMWRCSQVGRPHFFDGSGEGGSRRPLLESPRKLLPDARALIEARLNASATSSICATVKALHGWQAALDATRRTRAVAEARAEHARHRAPPSRRRGAKRSAPPEVPVEELTIRESDCLPYEYEGPPMATMGGGGCVIA